MKNQGTLFSLLLSGNAMRRMLELRYFHEMIIFAPRYKKK